MLIFIFVTLIVCYAIHIIYPGNENPLPDIISRDNKRNWKVRFEASPSRRIICVGRGNTIGSAIIDGCYKILYSANSYRSKEIEIRLFSMRDTLNRCYQHISTKEAKECEQFIKQMESRLSTCKAYEQQKEQEAKRERQRKVEQGEKKKVEALEYRIENAQSLSALLNAIDNAKRFQKNSILSKWPTNLEIINAGKTYEIINVYIDKQFDAISQFAVEYVQFSKIRSKVNTLDRNIKQSFNQLPKESQQHYICEKRKLFEEAA